LTGELLSSIKKALPPDAIICANNYLAYGCLQELQKSGVAVPETMGLITFDQYPFSQYTQPALSTISIDMFDLGKQAGALLIGKIKQPNLQVQTFSTLAHLIVQGSTRILIKNDHKGAKFAENHGRSS
jgi:DNA-binding LacI/PurR family transcriptional regulator